MANRNQNYPSGRQGREDDNRGTGRDPNAEDDRYGSYTETDEGDSSVRAGSYDQGRGRPGRDTGDQGGSGRFAGYGSFGQGDYSGGRGGRDQGGDDRHGNQDRFRGGNYGGGVYGSGNYGGGGGSGGGGGPRQQSSEGHSGGSRSFSGYGYEGSASSGGRGQPGGQRSDQRHGGWNEPHGEGQRYSPGVQHGGQYGAQQSGSSGTGDHRGKGPKGYQRSDERLKEMICERLRDDPEIDPSEVSVTVQGGKVTLEGTVDSRHAKNAIEDVAEQFGVQDVQNFLRVQKATQMGGQSGEGGRGASTGKPGEDAGIVRNRH